MIFSLASDIGKVRKNNEDFIDSQIIYKDDDTKIGIFALADGMGGHNKGEVASAMAVNGIIEFLSQNLSQSGNIKIDYFIDPKILNNKRDYQIVYSFLNDIISKSKDLGVEINTDKSYINLTPINIKNENVFELNIIQIIENYNNQFLVILEKENIESRPVWKPMHLQPFYKNCKFVSIVDGNKSVAEDLFLRGICLPSDTKMSKEDMNKIIKIIKGLF